MARGLNDMIKAYEQIVDEADELIEFSVEASEDDLILAQREQMLDGYDQNLERIGVYKSPSYEREKLAQNPRAGGWVDLYRSGRFQAAITVNVLNGALIFESTDPKTEGLVDYYGERIFGLSEFYREKFIDDSLRTNLISRIRKILSR